jgi:hypothetical protein
MLCATKLKLRGAFDKPWPKDLGLCSMKGDSMVTMLEARAAHEAGHIVVARILGYDTKKAYVSESMGRSDIRCRISQDTKGNKCHIGDQTFSLVAGIIEARFSSSAEAIRLLSDQALIAISGSKAQEQRCNIVEEMPFDDARKFGFCIDLLSQTGKDQTDLYYEFNIKAIEMISANWHQVQQIAGLLVANRDHDVDSDELENALRR